MPRSSKRKGNDFENQQAKAFGGLIYTGTDGDVIVPGTPYMLECKFRTGLNDATLKEWHDQIRTYEQRNPYTYLLVYGGGRTYQNARTWVSMPRTEFLRLMKLVYFGGIDKEALIKQLERMLVILKGS